MPQQKRKVSGDGDGEALEPPDRANWPGWVEVESEPALFNVMLDEMGVRGIKMQEVYSLDDEMLAMLQQPVHALIFLFRYRKMDEEHNQTGSMPGHVWFANQIPDFACATVALLNIVNNIADLELGPELTAFREMTRNMDPVSRGQEIDNFDFVRCIHNSFARETDLLNADMHTQAKIQKQKRVQAAAKGRATLKAKRADQAAADDATHAVSDTAKAPTPISLPDMENIPSSPLSDLTATPPKVSPIKRARLDDDDYSLRSKERTTSSSGPRRSSRKPKPTRNLSGIDAENDVGEDEEGFHFIAYMPIAGHLWKLDGLDRYPQDLGAFSKSPTSASQPLPNWMSIAQSTIAARMAQLGDADVSFNLMAVVDDPVIDTEDIQKSIFREIGRMDRKREKIMLRENPGISLKEYVLLEGWMERLDPEPAAEVNTLIDERNQLVSEQRRLQACARDGRASSREDREMARHRRFDYTTFVREWLGALAEEDLLGDLFDMA